jgi:hypothetical protein
VAPFHTWTHDSLLAASLSRMGRRRVASVFTGSAMIGKPAAGYTRFPPAGGDVLAKRRSRIRRCGTRFRYAALSQTASASIGFGSALCVGEVRIAWRAGGCRTLPMTLLPLPNPLIELAGR